MEAGIPDAYGMTKKIYADLLGQRERIPGVVDVLSLVIGGLIFQNGAKGENPYKGIDIEDLFEAIDFLSLRGELGIESFVGSWHPRISEIERHKPSHYDYSFFERLKDYIKMIAAGKFSDENPLDSADFYEESKAEDRLKLEFQQILDATRNSSFKDAKAQIIGALRRTATVRESNDLEYLTPVVNLIDSRDRLTIASLNYDNSLEFKSASHNLPVYTGIEDWSNSESIQPPETGLTLLKLHGSIDWTLKDIDIQQSKKVPHQVIKKIPLGENPSGGTDSTMIIGKTNKLTANGPFLELLRAFESELHCCSLLTVVGYSFRDNHVNEYIRRWLNRSDSNRIRVVDPNPDIRWTPEEPTFLYSVELHCKDRFELLKLKAGDGFEKMYSGNPGS